MRNRSYLKLLMFGSFLAILSSCSYDFIEYPVVIPPDPDVTVSFAEKIAPIFTTDDKCTSCHKTGGSAPHDFTIGNAYTAIVPGLVNLADPESSLIYWHPNASSTVHMWKKLSVGEADLILLWIKQGAKNN